MNVFMAPPRPLVPAVAGIALLVPMPPIITVLLLVLPSMTPPAASLIIAVTMADDEVMPWVWAYCDRPASAMP